MRKVLVVEDNENNMYLLRFIFRKRGHEVLEARSAEEGIKILEREHPDLVLMDVQLPGINGLEAVKVIRKIEGGEDVPIVALTSYTLSGDREKALKAGCTGYIEKPINPKTFIQDVEQFMGGVDDE